MLHSRISKDRLSTYKKYAWRLITCLNEREKITVHDLYIIDIRLVWLLSRLVLFCESKVRRVHLLLECNNIYGIAYGNRGSKAMDYIANSGHLDTLHKQF